MSMGAGMMLVGAESRLLPLSLPFRFFVAAGIFHFAFWLALLIGGADIHGFTLGLGPGLAAIHLLTLGVFTMTAIGAALQLLPVASKRPIKSQLGCRIISWLMVPGVACLTYGMWVIEHDPLAIGTFLTVPGLALFAYLALNNLRFGRGFEIVSANGWAAILCLTILLALGFALIADIEHGFLEARTDVGLIHLVVAAYGFMGLFAVGFGYVLLPMFAMGRSIPKRVGFFILIVWSTGIAAAVAGLQFNLSELISLGAGIGLVGVAIYILAMEKMLRTAMKKRLGLSFHMIRISWAFLILSLLSAAILPFEQAPEWLAQIFGLLLLPGWLLTFLMGVLQRIAPFLASMHSASNGHQPALLSTLTPERPLLIHGVSHFTALAFIAGSYPLDMLVLFHIGAAIGVIGGLSFLWFLIDVLQRLNRHIKAEIET